jgi:bifunctional non-homologous end joining protein LigD
MPKDAKENDRLRAYRAKRSADKTTEPFGGEGAMRPGLFVVHKHAARRLHYDLRLEMEGVLRSWAVPKGPSLDPAEKRLAVFVEDHPIEYGDFEGVIPEGNYGAGPVIVWDRGRWSPLEDPAEGLRKGKLLFELAGYKLRGVWTLVRTKGSETEWLLIKKPDAYSNAEAGDSFPQDSVLSGRTIEELEQGTEHGGEIRAELEHRGAKRRVVRAAEVELMLAERREAPFSRPGWIFEIKYDGYRLLAAREGERPVLRYRRGNEATSVFPEIAAAVAALPFQDLVLDGEVVVLDERGRPSFQRLQKRALLTRHADIERAAVALPATLFAFDLLGFEGFDLRGLPLLVRKEMLRRILPRVGPIRFSDHVEERGEELFAEGRRLDLEGVVAKRADSPYRAGRSPDWQKIRALRTCDLAVVGFTRPESSRSGFGALHLAFHDGKGLVYAGRVGSGFSDAELDATRKALEEARCPKPPCTGATPRGPGNYWVEPKLVCEVRFAEWTEEGLLRQPVFLRFRDDKLPVDCAREGDPPAPEPSPAPEEPASEHQVPFTNLQKIFWPAEKYTKGDLIDYYRTVSPWLLEYLRDRPVVLTRYPDGIEGKNFFQKDAPGFVPGWVRTERMWSEHASREIDYFVCDDELSLLYLINMGSIPLHIWSSRVRTLAQPDWCILDLDPKGAPFTDVVKVALRIRSLCEEIELCSFVKTSGSTGLHVLLPLGGHCTYEQSRTLGGLLARIVAEELPDIATVTRVIADRGGRVYLDYLQNGHGRLLVSPFSVRPLPGAPVSTPLEWREVTPRLDIRKFTIRTVPKRLDKRPEDPLRPVLSSKPDLVPALARLLEKLRA